MGKVEPDVVARLRLGERRLTLLIEWDRGTEGRGHLQRKLRHYVGWGASPAARNSLALVITTTPCREWLVHDLVSGLARAVRRAATSVDDDHRPGAGQGLPRPHLVDARPALAPVAHRRAGG